MAHVRRAGHHHATNANLQGKYVKGTTAKEKTRQYGATYMGKNVFAAFTAGKPVIFNPRGK